MFLLRFVCVDLISRNMYDRFAANSHSWCNVTLVTLINNLSNCFAGFYLHAEVLLSCKFVGSLVCYAHCDISKITSPVFVTFGINVQHMCYISLLTFERSRVKTAVLKNLQSSAQLWFKISSSYLAVRQTLGYQKLFWHKNDLTTFKMAAWQGSALSQCFLVLEWFGFTFIVFFFIFDDFHLNDSYSLPGLTDW